LFGWPCASISDCYSDFAKSGTAIAESCEFLCAGAKNDMSSCSTGRHVLLHKKTCLVVQTRRLFFLSNRKTCLLVQQQETPSCSTRRLVVLLSNRKTCLLSNKKTCPLLVQQEAMSFLMFSKKSCFRVPHEVMSSCPARRHFFLTRRHVLLLNRRSCPLVQHEDTSSRPTRRHGRP